MSGAAIEQRTYWLSFCDSDRPRGQQFLGACVVQVTSDDVARALAIRPDMYDPVKGPWIAAAVMVAWAHRCNPGGEVASVRVDDIPGGATLCAYCCPDHDVELDLCDTCARRPYASPSLVVRALSAAVSERN